MQTYGKIISVQQQILLANQDQLMNALRTVPGHTDVINVHEFRQIVRGLKNKKAVGNDRITSEVYKLASERLLTMMSIFLSACKLTGKLPSTLIHVVIILLVKCKSKDPADINNYNHWRRWGGRGGETCPPYFFERWETISFSLHFLNVSY